jgi:hypothetical protein
VLTAWGSNVLVPNGQGYVRLNVLTLEPLSYNLNLPGASGGIYVVPSTSSASTTTFVVAGIVTMSAVVVDDA